MKYTESQMNKYVTKLMDLLYTPDELKNGLIIETEKTSSKRQRLDLDKFNLIKGKNTMISIFYGWLIVIYTLVATINKFKLSNEIKAAAEIREIACRKCRDKKKTSS
jgi:hypothetical protein